MGRKMKEENERVTVGGGDYEDEKENKIKLERICAVQGTKEEEEKKKIEKRNGGKVGDEYLREQGKSKVKRGLNKKDEKEKEKNKIKERETRRE